MAEVSLGVSRVWLLPRQMVNGNGCDDAYTIEEAITTSSTKKSAMKHEAAMIRQHLQVECVTTK
ncbi:unnamed protein product [Ceratitis capitata]|uniref:(Mediterranean fruit fly) hypothetical protein n=1 Tax=Ceratitis capitata TaxID=7213 RepID=A0A811V9L8_CERCA|nr:unnamed protein product [Ceratitis capitata]